MKVKSKLTEQNILSERCTTLSCYNRETNKFNFNSNSCAGGVYIWEGRLFDVAVPSKAFDAW